MKNSVADKKSRVRSGMFCLLVWAAGLAVNACTVKPVTVPLGVIPQNHVLSPEDQDFGTALFASLRDDYKLNQNHPRYQELHDVFSKLVWAADADHMPWYLYLFDQPAIVDVRAVHGNYIFVWSGFLEHAKTEDEVAAILACELAHSLAGHTRPVEFTSASQMFFNLAEVATSFGLMALSQGAVGVSGLGWMKHAYVELSDLDPLDRKYSEVQTQEALQIARMILDRSDYNPRGMTLFWERVYGHYTPNDDNFRLNHGVPIEKRLAMLEKMSGSGQLPASRTLADAMSSVFAEYAADTQSFYYP